MRIGILNADQLNKAIISRFGDYGFMFKQLLQRVSADLSFRSYDVVASVYPEDIYACDAYILSGSKCSAYDKDAWILELIEFVKLLEQKRIKLLGICFGHQLIAQALGGLTQQYQQGWGVGLHTSHIMTDKDWFNPAVSDFSLLYSHQDQVIRLPQNAQIVAGNSFCQYSSYQVDEHILTFQGHPEFVPEYMRYILDKRKVQIGEEKYISAMKSLQHKADDLIVAEWMVNFLHS